MLEAPCGEAAQLRSRTSPGERPQGSDTRRDRETPPSVAQEIKNHPQYRLQDIRSDMRIELNLKNPGVET